MFGSYLPPVSLAALWTLEHVSIFVCSPHTNAHTECEMEKTSLISQKPYPKNNLVRVLKIKE